MIKQPINKRRRFVEDSNDASHSTLVEKAEEPIKETPSESKVMNDDEDITVTDRLEFERGLSRRKRKTLKKQEKFEKRKDLLKRITETKESLQKKKKQQPKTQGIFSFDPMSKLLQNEETTLLNKQEKPKKESNEVAKKNKKMKNEIEQFTNVLNHPIFQSNPLQAIQQHLQNKMKALPQNNTSSASTSKKNEKKTTPDNKKPAKPNLNSVGNKKKQPRKAKFNTNRAKESFDKNVESLDKVGKRKRND